MLSRLLIIQLIFIDNIKFQILKLDFKLNSL